MSLALRSWVLLGLSTRARLFLNHIFARTRRAPSSIPTPQLHHDCAHLNFDLPVALICTRAPAGPPSARLLPQCASCPALHARVLFDSPRVQGELVTDEEIDMMIRIADSDGKGLLNFFDIYAIAQHPNPAAPLFNAKRVGNKLKERMKSGQSSVSAARLGLADEGGRAA